MSVEEEKRLGSYSTKINIGNLQPGSPTSYSRVNLRNTFPQEGTCNEQASKAEEQTTRPRGNRWSLSRCELRLRKVANQGLRSYLTT